MIYSCWLLNIIVLSRDIISLELLLFRDVYFTLKSFSYSRQFLLWLQNKFLSLNSLEKRALLLLHWQGCLMESS
jgi:hypothetical protein